MNTNIFLFLLCICFAPLTTYGQNVGIHTPTPKTTLEAKSRVIVRDVRPFDEDNDLYSLYVSQTDFDRRYDGVRLTAKKGQLIKIKTQSNYKMFTYELYLKVGKECYPGGKDCDKKWTDWVDMYNTGIDYEKYAMFITEANLFRVNGNKTGTGSNELALIGHREIGENENTKRVNPLKIVYLTKKELGSPQNGRDMRKNYYLHADYRGGELFMASTDVSPDGFYWKIRFVIIDRSIIEELNGQMYTMNLFTNGATPQSAIPSRLNDDVIDRPNYPTDLFIFNPSEKDLKTSINSDQAEAILDVHGNMSITETNDAWPVKKKRRNLSPLFVDNDGYLYSFKPKDLLQKPFNLIEGYINTIASGSGRDTREHIVTRMYTPETKKSRPIEGYSLIVGNKDNVGVFDTRIPYNEYFVLTTNTSFGNYEHKRRYIQMLRDRHKQYVSPDFNPLRDNSFLWDNWYSTYTLLGFRTPAYPYDEDYNYGNSNIVIPDPVQDRAWIRDKETNYDRNINKWSYIFAMGHYVTPFLKTYNSSPVSLLFPEKSKDLTISNNNYVLNDTDRGKTWHLSLDYPRAEPIFGLCYVSRYGVFFQPNTYSQYQHQFYWKYNLVAISKSMIKDLGYFLDDMTYFDAKNYNHSTYYTEYGSVRTISPATYQPTFGDNTLKYLKHISGFSTLINRDIKMPITPGPKSDIKRGYITSFSTDQGLKQNNTSITGGVYYFRDAPKSPPTPSNPPINYIPNVDDYK